MKHIVKHTTGELNAATTVNIPGDLYNYRRGKYLTEAEVTLEFTGVQAGTIAITAKRIGSTDFIEPESNGTITPVVDVPQSVTFYGSFSAIKITPDATFIAAAGTYKLILNAGEPALRDP